MSAMTFAIAIIIIGIFLVILEAFIPGFFIAIPGTAIIVFGILSWILGMNKVITSWWGWTIVLLCTAIAAIFTIMLYKKIAPISEPETTTSDGLVGKIGIVTRETDPEIPTYGKVRIGSELWSAEASRVIPKGRKVKVIGSEGVHLVVASLRERKKEVSK